MMMLKWIQEPFGGQVSIQWFMGPDARHLRYAGTLVMSPAQWEAVVDALLLGEARVVALEPASATLALAGLTS
jgi:hypothetical protein